MPPRAANARFPICKSRTGDCHKTGSGRCQSDSRFVRGRHLACGNLSRVQHILIVDDDPAIRNVVADILEMSDYSVRMATNGIEALQELRAHPPAVVLLDLMMPVMDGWEFLRQIKHNAIQVPVAVMSAARDAGNVSDEWGAQAFLPKPFELD